MPELDIILTCNYSPWSKYSGGGQKSTHMLACALLKLGHSVKVVYSKGWLEKVTIPENVPYKVHWAQFFALYPSMASPFRFLNPYSFKAKVQQISSPESIVHSQGEEAAQLKTLALKWIHSNRFPDFPKHIQKLDLKTQNTPFKLWLRDPKYGNVHKCLKNAQTVVVTSRHNANKLKYYFDIQSTVIPNGLDSVYFSKCWQFNQECRGLLYFGRLVYAKGVDTLLEGYALLAEPLRRQHPLLIIGNGKDKAAFQKQAESLDLSSHITWLSWANAHEILNLMMEKSLVVLPSREESFGNTMLESLASGTPTLTTNAGSIPEVVGDQGILVEAGDPLVLKTAIEKSLANLPKHQPQLQQNVIKNKYSWEATAQQYISQYTSL